MVDLRNMTEAELAAQRETVGKFYYWLPGEKKKAARDLLRHLTKHDDFRQRDGSADVVLEAIWNALLGNV